jgi:Dockerin type I domain
MILETPLLGDVDGNGEIEAYDSALALQHAVGIIQLNEWQSIAADVDRNTFIDAYDAALILQYYVQIITQFP